jgi:hypothetical protein
MNLRLRPPPHPPTAHQRSQPWLVSLLAHLVLLNAAKGDLTKMSILPPRAEAAVAAQPKRNPGVVGQLGQISPYVAGPRPRLARRKPEGTKTAPSSLSRSLWLEQRLT